jgi:hypothetical protein
MTTTRSLRGVAALTVPKSKGLDVRRAVTPKPGHRTGQRIEYERQRWFRRGRAWRVGGEARISRLKHCFGMHRTPYRGEDGMGRTVFWAAIANNLAAMAATVAEIDPRSDSRENPHLDHRSGRGHRGSPPPLSAFCTAV